jgi:hypothetical protein
VAGERIGIRRRQVAFKSDLTAGQIHSA